MAGNQDDQRERARGRSKNRFASMWRTSPVKRHSRVLHRTGKKTPGRGGAGTGTLSFNMRRHSPTRGHAARDGRGSPSPWPPRAIGREAAVGKRHVKSALVTTQSVGPSVLAETRVETDRTNLEWRATVTSCDGRERRERRDVHSLSMADDRLGTRLTRRAPPPLPPRAASFARPPPPPCRHVHACRVSPDRLGDPSATDSLRA